MRVRSGIRDQRLSAYVIRRDGDDDGLLMVVGT